MLLCEKCSKEHDGSYASGRFCTTKCSRSFASANKRDEINKKVSLALTKEKIYLEKQCPICNCAFKVLKSKKAQKTCSSSCGSKLSNSDPKKKEYLSAIRTKAILAGQTNSFGTKCNYAFCDTSIKCDSKIEYTCLDFFEKTFTVKNIERCNFSIPYIFNGIEKRYIPDFLIKTNNETYIVECKSYISSKNLNDKWRKYNELSILKKDILIEFCNKNNYKYFWFTKSLHIKYYNSLNF